MAATFNWCEDHGAATGSPAKGTTRDGFGASTNYALNCNWKTADDTNVTAHSAAAIGPPPDNSYEKFQYLKITGSFTSVSAMKWTCHANRAALSFPVPDSPYVKLMGQVTGQYTTPSRSLNSSLLTDFTKQVWAHQGLPVRFSPTGPEGTTADTLSAAGYTQYLVSQLQISNAGLGIVESIEDLVVAVVWSET